MKFSDVIGQYDLKIHLRSTCQNNRLSHAQLFLGNLGYGGLPLALAYAQFINCLNPTMEDSCGECSSCRKIQKLAHPDLHFTYPVFAVKDVKICSDIIGPWREAVLENPYLTYTLWGNKLESENKQGNIPAAECREIIKKLSLKSFEAKYKILIIWLPEFLGNEGNILLKLMEEPPPDTILILVGQELDRIINTLISRTQLLKINKIKDEDLLSVLINKYSVNEEDANEILFIADGDYSKALEYLQENEVQKLNIFRDWFRFCYEKNGEKLIKLIDEIAKTGRENQKALLLFGIKIIRECILVKEGVTGIVKSSKEMLEFVKKLSRFIDSQNQDELYNELNKAHFHIERNGSAKIVFLDLSVKIGILLRKEELSLTDCN